MRTSVGRFINGMRDALDDLLDPENLLCFQQVHDGDEKACRSALADLGLDWTAFD